MSMALDIKERVALKQLLGAVQRHLGLTPTVNVVADADAARRALEARPTFGRLDEGEG